MKNGINIFKICRKEKMAISLSNKLVSCFLSIIFVFAFISIKPALKVNAIVPVPVFSNPATVEEDIENELQTAIDSMRQPVSTDISWFFPPPKLDEPKVAPINVSTLFIIDGIEISKKFLKTDRNGNFIMPLDDKDGVLASILDHTFMDMNDNINIDKNSDFNPYNRLAIAGYSITMNMSYSTSTINNTVISMKLLIGFSFTWHDGPNALAGRNAVIAHANNFLNSSAYTSKTTAYAKLKAINQYVCSTFQYDYRVFVLAELNQTIYTAYKMITDNGGIGGYPRGVCQAYAMYGYIILKEAGFEAITIDGHAPRPPISTPENNPHAWNMVKVGSNWYHIDFTWNDPVTGGNPAPYTTRQNGAGSVSENYLLRSDTEIGVNHTWSKIQDEFTYPIASAKWTGTPTIINITQPPAPTLKPTAIPTKIIVPTPTKKPTGTDTQSASVSELNSSSSELSSSPSSPSPYSSASEQTNNTPKESMQTATITINPTKPVVTPGKQTDSDVLSQDKPVNISGVLSDENSNPIPNTKIELYNTSMTTTTDSKGFYQFKNVMIGSYKIYLLDKDGKVKAELPIVISYGDNTDLTSDAVTVKWSSLVMDLTLKGNVLTIRSVSSSFLQFTNERLLIILLVSAIIIILLLIIFLKAKKRKVY